MPRKLSLSTRKATIIDALEDIKAKDIIAIEVKRLTSVCDWVVIATAESSRQTKALARHVQEAVRNGGGSIIGTEGEETGDWVLVDAGDIVVHIMQPQTRAYYNLEELWSQGKLERVGGVGRRPATMENPELPPGVTVHQVRTRKPAVDAANESEAVAKPKRIVTRTAREALADIAPPTPKTKRAPRSQASVGGASGNPVPPVGKKQPPAKKTARKKAITAPASVAPEAVPASARRRRTPTS
jgi:ribosome-associated protein